MNIDGEKLLADLEQQIKCLRDVDTDWASGALYALINIQIKIKSGDYTTKDGQE